VKNWFQSFIFQIHLVPLHCGAKAAGDALRRCPSLKRLGLAANDIGAEGARLLVRGMMWGDDMPMFIWLYVVEDLAREN
jgi:hypothetical protein